MMNLNKKRTILVVSIILVLIIIYIALLMKNSKNYKLQQIDKYEYFLLNIDEKYGVIDKSGNTVIEPEYEEIIIPNPIKDVFICTNSEEKIILNSNNEELFTEYEEVFEIRIKDLILELPYEKTVLKYRENEKYGLINLEGKKITNAVYDSIQGFTYKEGELLVSVDGKYGLININGKLLIDIEYDLIESDYYYTEENGYNDSGYIVCKKTGQGYRYGYINNNWNVLLDTDYNKLYRIIDVNDNNIYIICAENGRFGVKKNKDTLIENKYQSIEFDELTNIFTIEVTGKYGIANIDGDIVLDTAYDSIQIQGTNIYGLKDGESLEFDINGNQKDYNDNYKLITVPTDTQDYNIIVKIDDSGTRYGVADSNGNIVIECEYSYIERLMGDYFVVYDLAYKVGILNSANETVLDFNYSLIQKVDDTNLVQAFILDDSTIEVYSNNMEKIYSAKNTRITVRDRYVKLYSENDLLYVDYNGSTISNTKILKNNVLFADKKNGRWGFINKNNDIVIDYMYDKVTDFNEYGYAGIKQEGKWGVINSNGEIILDPTYDLDASPTEPYFIGEYYRVNYNILEYYYSNEIN